jgi:linoleoyl-CoA desaturase
MKRLKFSRDNGTDFYRELNDRLDHYFESNNIPKTGNAKMIAKMTMYFALDVLFFYLMITSTSVISFFVFYLLMGLSVLLTAFNISHDAAHGVAVKSRWWNKALFQVSFNLLGNNAYVWGKNHNESHHLYTNIEGSDIDVLNNPLVRMTETQQLRWYHRFQHIYTPFLYLFYSLNWFFREGLMLIGISSRTIDIQIPPKEIIKLILFKAFYIGYMIVIPAMVFTPGLAITAFLVTHAVISILFVAVLAVSHLSDYVQHPSADEHGKLPMSWPKLQMCTSLDYNSKSEFLNWTLGGFNAHTIHHLLPNICHIHYVDILPIFEELCEKYGLTYMEVRYRRSVASHFRFLKGMGNNENFKPLTFAR